MDDGVTLEHITQEQQWDIFDRMTRRLLNISGTQFMSNWNAGQYIGKGDDGGHEIIRCAMICPSGFLNRS